MLIESIDNLLLEALSPGAVQYVRFASEEGAHATVKARKIKQASYIEGIYAVAEGGTYVPGVVGKDREWAVIFKTKHPPNSIYPEEVIWYGKSIPVTSAKVVSASEGKKLLTGSRVVTVLGDETLKGIPWHPTHDPFDKVPWPPNLLKEVVALIKKGRKIQAIKVVTEHYGMKLKGARWYVERLATSLA